MSEIAIMIIGGFIIGVLVFVEILRWALRINVIIASLSRANQHLARIDQWMECIHNEVKE